MTRFLFVTYFMVIWSLTCASPTVLPEDETTETTTEAVTIPPDACLTSDGQIVERDIEVSPPLGKCYGMRCTSDLKLEYQHCPEVLVPKGCYGAWYDYAYQYPDCCPAAVCNASHGP